MSELRQIQALQLIYTNVEVDQSPARQRGFQVWLCSPELTSDQRRAIAKRLDDFRLPVGANVQSANLQRHVSFRLDQSWFVVARSVPSMDRDKFGRGGKFHAHALIVAAEMMRLLQFDPFRIIDGGFAFHSAPSEAMTSESWRSGSLPVATVPLSVREAASRDGPPRLLASLCAHGEAPDSQPIVVAEPPDALLDRLRNWFTNLPATVRERFAFDTLSAGTMSPDRRYFVSGAYSHEQLKLWSFRRFHRFDPAAGTFSPALPTTAPPFVEQLFRQNGWGTLHDEDRDAVYLVARSMAGGRIDCVKWVPLSPASMAVLEACPDVGALKNQLVRLRVQKDVPAALCGLPRVLATINTHLEGSLTAVLPRVAEPIPRPVVARAILDDLGRSHSPPAEEVLNALETWLAAGMGSARLELILRRWRQAPRDIEKIEAFLQKGEGSSARVQWFRNWLAGTLPRRTSQDYIRDLPVDRPPSPEKLTAARLHLALGDADSHEENRDLAMAIALHCDGDRLRELLASSGRAPAIDRWVQLAAARRLRGSFTPGWANDGLGGVYLGFFIRTKSPVDETLLEYLASSSSVSGGFHRMLAEYQFGTSPEPESMPRYVIEPDWSEDGKQLFKGVLEADAKKLHYAVESFRGYLEGANDECFAACVNVLLQQVYGIAVVKELSEDVYVTGLKLHWIQRTKVNNQMGLFEAMAGATTPEINCYDATGIDPGRWRGSNHRLKWLMTRLEHPVTTQNLRL